MVKFINNELRKSLMGSLDYIKEYTNSKGGIYIDLRDAQEFIDNDEIDEDDVCEDEVIIDENYKIGLYFEYNEDDEIDVRIDEFIKLIDLVKRTELVDNAMYITKNKIGVRIKSNNEYLKLDCLLSANNEIFKHTSSFNGVNITCSIKRIDELFGLLICKSCNYDKYYPCIVGDELYLEICVDDNKLLNRLEVEEVFNSYIFEISSSYNFSFSMHPREENIEEDIDEDTLVNKIYNLRALMFGKGIANLTKLFNGAEQHMDNYDYAIIEYTKIIEYVSQTIIREELIEEANKKLYSSKALNPDANYIKELEEVFIDHKNKYDSDRNAIKITAEKCCDIFELIGLAPKYLNKINDLQKTLSKKGAKRDDIISAAYTQLTDAISDTRNCLSHAKANYTLNGQECPEEQKNQYVKMIRIIAIQVIRWFYKVSESKRIV